MLWTGLGACGGWLYGHSFRCRVVRAELEPSSSLESKHPPFSSDLGAPSPGVPPKPGSRRLHSRAVSPQASMGATAVGQEGELLATSAPVSRPPQPNSPPNGSGRHRDTPPASLKHRKHSLSILEDRAQRKTLIRSRNSFQMSHTESAGKSSLKQGPVLLEAVDRGRNGQTDGMWRPRKGMQGAAGRPHAPALEDPKQERLWAAGMEPEAPCTVWLTLGAAQRQERPTSSGAQQGSGPG